MVQRALVAAIVTVALLLWASRRMRSEPTDFTADALEFFDTVVRPF